MKISRRDFLRLFSASAGAVTMNSLLAACQTAGVTLPVAATHSMPTSIPVIPLEQGGLVELAINAVKSEAQILAGAKTRVWQYQTEMLKGDAGALTPIEGSYLAPVIRIKRGQTFRAKLTNELDEPTIIHWHGLNVPAQMDGHPHLAIASGKTYDYEFVVRNRAGTYWFHPHPHTRTGIQAYSGMAGLFIVHDDEESALGLPAGEFDLPLVIQDRLFDADNQLLYNGDPMIGFMGSTLLVNGKPDFNLSAAARAYRLRILNGSNARIYKLAWSDSSKITVIGTDGGLLEKPVTRDYVTLAPGQRVELWADFSQYKKGGQIKLVSQQFTADFETGMMGGGFLPQGSPFDILTVNFEQESAEKSTLPEVLSTSNSFDPKDASRTYRVELAMQHMTGTLNGRVYAMEEVARDETVKLGALEIWEFANTGGGGMGMGGMGMGGMMMAQPHPMHMHAVQFKVIERAVENSSLASGNDSLSAGLVDEGWHDTVLTMPGERVRVLVKFDGFEGMFLYHCHNLEHEDGGMMRNFEIVA
jgi:FtsP/CotA-like multicopper oxidase with cupredoxin domain